MLTIVPVVRKNKLGKTCIVKLNIQLCKNETRPTGLMLTCYTL